MASRSLRILILSIGLCEACIFFFHILGIERSSMWQWPFENGSPFVLVCLASAAIPFGIAVILRTRGLSIWLSLTLIVLSVSAMQMVGLIYSNKPPDPLLPAVIVEDRVDTSYWFDARSLVREHQHAASVLANYPALLPTLSLHSHEKPPGPVMFYFLLISLFGATSHVSAYLGAIVIALVTACGVPLVYLLAYDLLEDRPAAFLAACVFGLIPCMIALYPQFDTCYPAVVCAMSLLWLRAIRGKPFFALALGVFCAATLFFVYNLIVMGTFLVGLAIIESIYRGVTVRKVATASIIAAAAACLCYVLFWLFTRFNPIATFLAALKYQNYFNDASLHRSYWKMLPIDFYDFLYGSSRMLAFAALLSLPIITHRRIQWRIRLCLGQIAIVALTGLLRGETARVWCFLTPLLAIPAGAVLVRWPLPWRLAFLAVLGTIMAVMVQNVGFNVRPLPWERIDSPIYNFNK